MKPRDFMRFGPRTQRNCNEAAYPMTHVPVKSMSMAACNVLQRCFQDQMKF